MEPRPTCQRCERPISVCYCAHVRPLTTRTRIRILQHPREEGMPVGTAKMASLCLVGSQIEVGVDFDGSRLLAEALSDAAHPPALLYPGPEARDIAEHPAGAPLTLIVIDGTWPQAKKIVRNNPRLAALPRYSFVPPRPSDYRIRKEPRAEYLSTIESLAHVLGVLEGEPERFESLRAPFTAMVEAQLGYAQVSTAPRHRKRARRAPTPPGPPPIFRERAADLLCVVAETSAWPAGSEHRAEGDPGELVHCVAVRVRSGERLEAIVATEHPLGPYTGKHLQLDEARLARGLPREELAERWRRFARDTDVLVVWGSHTPRALTAAGLTLPETRVDLRRAARVILNQRVGPIDAVAERLLGRDPSLVPSCGEGRAGRRLGLMLALSQAWTGVADASDPATTASPS